MAIPDFVRTVNTTAQEFMKGAVNNTIRASLYLSMLRKRGRITTGHSGKYVEQKIQFADGEAQTRGDMQPVTYAPQDQWRTLEIPWRSMLAADMMSEGERLKNDGTPAIVKVYGGTTERLKASLDSIMRTQLYTDGNANATDFHGFDSFAGTGTTVAADIVAQPSDSYFGQSTNVGASGGTWTTTAGVTAPNAAIGTDWPYGSGSASYDWLAPKLLNWSSSGWGTSVVTWEGNCERTLRQGKMWCDTLAAGQGKLDLVTMDTGMLFGFKNKQSGKQQIHVPHKEAEDLGFPETLNFEGMALHSEFGVPANSAYGHNLMTEEFMILGPDFYRIHGPDFDTKYLAWLFSCSIWGNMRYNPKFSFKAKNYA